MLIDLPILAAATGAFLAAAGLIYAIKNKPRGEQRIKLLGVLDVQTKSFAVVLLVCGCALLGLSLFLKPPVATSVPNTERPEINATAKGDGNIAIGRAENSTITIQANKDGVDAK